MSDSIDTEIKGDPGEIRGLAADIRGSVAPAVAAVADSLVDARLGAEDYWRSPAGDAFTATVHGLVLPADDLAEYLSGAADALDALAGELEHSQRLMEAVRADASSAGLTVRGFIIEDPGPELPAPGPLAPGADGASAEAHRQRAVAHAAQSEKVDAFTRAAGEASEIRAKETEAARVWGAVVGDKQQRKLGFTAVAFGLDVVAGESTLRGKKHLKSAAALLSEARALSAQRASLTGFDERMAISARTRALIGEAANAQEKWRASTRLSQTMARTNGVLAVGGIAYDIVVLDRPWHEAAISGGASFAASVATGALVGSAIPIPLVGTVAGAAFGAGAAIFTSGVVDNLFEGKGVRQSIDAGSGAIADAIGTASDGARTVWKALF